MEHLLHHFLVNFITNFFQITLSSFLLVIMVFLLWQKINETPQWDCLVPICIHSFINQDLCCFLFQCRPEYKVPGLYVVDSIVRQSRHQFGIDKDVFAPRFIKNITATFMNLLKCPPDERVGISLIALVQLDIRLTWGIFIRYSREAYFPFPLVA